MKPGLVYRRNLVVVLGLVILTIAPRCSVSFLRGAVAAAPDVQPTATPDAGTVVQPTAPADAVGPLPSDSDAIWVRLTGLFNGNLRQVGIAFISAGVVAAVLLAAVVLILLVGRGRRRKRQRSPAPSEERLHGQRLALPPGPCLVLVKGGDRRQPILLDPHGLTIGRADDNDLVIGELMPGWESVSQHHARISFENGRWILEDLQSRNGVYVNGRRTGRNLLQDGWTLAIGGVMFTFHAGSEEAA